MKHSLADAADAVLAAMAEHESVRPEEKDRSLAEIRTRYEYFTQQAESRWSQRIEVGHG